MAENFDLIFGQSASTQYAWSDSDYQNGWGTVGSTPPTAEQFDALQRRSDKKAQELNNALTPLVNQNTASNRQPVTAYVEKDIRYSTLLPTGWYLECTTAGTTDSAEITLPSPLVENATITDGTVVWKVRKIVPTYIKSITADGPMLTITKGDGTTAQLQLVTNNASAHNAVYRGKDLTAYFNSGGMSKAIADGTFKDIYPGDYITKSVTINGTTYSDVKWIVMDLDYHLHAGDTETTAHHVVLMPETTLGAQAMNATNITTGGYVGSVMWTTHIPKVVTGIKAAFGDTHVLSHRELLTNTVDDKAKSAAYNGWTGAASNWAWADVKVNLCNEPMVYGSRHTSSSFYDGGECIEQLAAFNLNHGLRCTKRRQWWWLRAVAQSAHFASVDYSGNANHGESIAGGGVRPYFLLY